MQSPSLYPSHAVWQWLCVVHAGGASGLRRNRFGGTSTDNDDALPFATSNSKVCTCALHEKRSSDLRGSALVVQAARRSDKSLRIVSGASSAINNNITAADSTIFVSQDGAVLSSQVNKTRGKYPL